MQLLIYHIYSLLTYYIRVYIVSKYNHFFILNMQKTTDSNKKCAKE